MALYDKELVAAVQSKNANQVNELLYRGADYNYRDSNTGENVLMMAAKIGSVPIVKSLFRKGVNVNVQDYDGNTALMFAAENGYKELAEWLVKGAHAKLHLRNRDMMTAADIADANGHEDLGNELRRRKNFGLGGKGSRRRSKSKKTRKIKKTRR